VANIFVAASATWNGKALKKAKQDVSVFDKQVKKLGGTLAAAFSARAIVRFGKETVKAFAADEAAAKSLEIQLKNTGFAFSSPAVELYIANLQKTTGVLDDELRPAFQQLLTVTGSITTSQNALNTAMDVSAATGKSLSQVTTALSRAYAGNTTGLSRLGAGLDKTLLKAGNMDDIMAELNKKFSGQALARLDTYAGKMSLFAASVANAEEIIGKGLLDALTELGDDKSIEGLSNNMEDFATATSEVIVGLGRVIGKLKAIGNIPGVDGSILRNLPYIGPALRAAEALRSAGQNPVDRGGQERTAGRVLAAQRRQEIKASQDLLKLKKQELATLKAKSAIDELSAKFDVERIGFQKALNEATDEETKLRIRGQLAILDNNEALAKKILEEMKAADAARKLGEALEASADKYDKMISGLIGQFRALGLSLQESMALAGMSARYQAQADAFAAGRGGGSGGGAPLSTDPYDILIRQLAPELNTSYGLSPQEAISLATMSARYQAQADAITLRIDASGDKMSQAIAESIQQATRNGYSTSGAGQLP
jgi:phage shock protein A